MRHGVRASAASGAPSRSVAAAVVVALTVTLLAAFAAEARAATPVTFGAKTDYPAGLVPWSVALGDVNGDAFPDLAVANSDADTVSVLLGDGAGGFGAKSDFATGTTPYSVVMGDLNGDSFLDLALANLGSNTVSVLLGDGTGDFGAKTDFATGLAPNMAALDDVNGDTFLDLVVANSDSSSVTVSVLLGDGTGSFGAKTDFGAGGSPFWVALGDVNGDTFLDLAVANISLDTVSVLLGDGAGGFGTKTSFATGVSPTSVALGDLNGDSFLDLAVTSFAGSSVSVLLGDGTGSFGAKNDFGAGPLPTSAVMSDLNGDTFLDLAVANGDGPGGVSVLLGDGAGSFGLRSFRATGASPYSVVIGDLNGDTFHDLAAANSRSNTVSVLLNTGAVPDAPTVGSAEAGPRSATVSWTAPGSDGGRAITGYVVTPYIGYYPLPPQTFASTATTQVVTGLTDGTQYRFRVRAVNAVGTGGYSRVTNPVTLPTVPGAPTIGTALAGNGEATVTWAPPALDGGSAITGYVVTPYIGYYPLPPQTFASTATTQVVTGLTDGTRYRFRVQAVNAVGTGGYSKVTNQVTPTP